LTEPMMARSPSASILLACSFKPFSLCTLAPTSQRMRSPSTLSISLPFFKGVRGARQHVDLHTAVGGAYETLDDHLVLERSFWRKSDSLARSMKCAIRLRPFRLHHVGLLARVEALAVPVGLEALGDLVHLVALTTA
jgi:hypothetical protein